MSSTASTAPTTTSANLKKDEELGPEVPLRRKVWMSFGSFVSLTVGSIALAIAFHVPHTPIIAFEAATIILVGNCIVYALLGRSKVRQFLLVTMWCMGIGVVLTVVAFALTMWQSNEARNLYLAKEGGEVTLFDDQVIKIKPDPLLKGALEQTEQVEKLSKYLGQEAAIAVLEKDYPALSPTAKAAREAAIKQLKDARPWWRPKWLDVVGDFYYKLNNLPVVEGWVQKLIYFSMQIGILGIIVYSVLRVTFGAGAKEIEAGDSAFIKAYKLFDRFISSWAGKGFMVFLGLLFWLMFLYAPLPDKPMPGSPNWEYARMEAAEAKAEAEEEARKAEEAAREAQKEAEEQAKAAEAKSARQTPGWHEPLLMPVPSAIAVDVPTTHGTTLAGYGADRNPIYVTY